MGVYNLVNPAGNENLDVDKMFASVNSMLDSSAGSNPKGFFSNFTVEVKWNSGLTPKTITEGFFFVDKETFKNIKLPDIGGSNKIEDSNKNGDSNSGGGTKNNNGTGGDKK